MRYLITAGPTREPIDPVRFISNRSSGRVGVSVARAARAAGHGVTLLLGCGASIGKDELEALIVEGVLVIHFDASTELQQELERAWPAHDVLVMAAAVADYRPSDVSDAKLTRGQSPTTLALVPTPDLVATAAANKRDDQFVVAFALEEPAVLHENAKRKLQEKRVDAIVANPIDTMEASDIDPTWFEKSGNTDNAGPMEKADFGDWLIDRIDAARGAS